MDSSSRFKIKSTKLAHERIDDEVVIIEFDTGNYYSLEKIGADIWEWIEQGANIEGIIKNISLCYDGSLPEIENGVKKLIDELELENLIAPDHSSAIPEDTDKPDLKKIEKKIRFEIPVLQKYTDMQELLLLDPIHEVDETGWPSTNFAPKEPKN